jgi:hypothetical protein
MLDPPIANAPFEISLFESVLSAYIAFDNNMQRFFGGLIAVVRQVIQGDAQMERTARLVLKQVAHNFIIRLDAKGF